MTARVPLTLGLFALVDDDDLAAVTEAGPWCAAPNGRTVKGVTFRRDSRRWAAQIQANGHHRHLGYYATPEEAAAAYDAAAVALFGEFARPNFPNGVPA